MSHKQETKESINHALAALEAETHEVVRGSNRLNDNLVRAGKKIWRQVLVIWAVGIVLVISYFILLNYKPVTTNQTHKQLVDQQAAGAKPAPARSMESSQSPLNVSQASPTSEREDLINLLGQFREAELKKDIHTFMEAYSPDFPELGQKRRTPLAISEQEDLINLLSQIREAELKKDIHMFMEAYSPDFPELGQKRKTMLTIWKKYTYVDSQFNLTDLQHENPLTIIGKVNWNIKAKDQGTGALKIVKRSYLVTFSKQSGKWLIQNMIKIDNKSN
jgi:ketosteroid isomerase-like protein